MKQREEIKDETDDGRKAILPFFQERFEDNVRLTDRVKDRITMLTKKNEILEAENADLKKRNSTLRDYAKMAYSDDLTGLPNRRFLDKRLSEEDARAHTIPNHVFSILFMDIDNFKLINDTYGHVAGDDILKWLANFLVQNVREQDNCCRLAGDEFIVVLPDTDASYTRTLINRLQQRLTDANCFLEIPIQVSFGCATFPENGTSIMELFHYADSEMYKDKNRPSRDPLPSWKIINQALKKATDIEIELT